MEVKRIGGSRKHNGCPFHESRRNRCTHKQGLRGCGFQDCTNCPLWVEWAELNKSIARIAKNDYKGYVDA